jgi:hypothetical protein
MARRLTLSTVGIKSPLDLSEEQDHTHHDEGHAERPHPRAPSQPRARRRSTPASGQPRRPASADAAFYGAGRPLQTSIAIDPDCATRLEQLARDTGISTNALTVAAVHAGLPASDDDAGAMIVDERVARAGLRTARIERNLRLPQHLRARLDELTDAARDRLPRATRADLVNAALRTGLPSTAEQAAELAISHARRVEQAATA